jgi:hypothetical protein
MHSFRGHSCVSLCMFGKMFFAIQTIINISTNYLLTLTLILILNLTLPWPLF